MWRGTGEKNLASLVRVFIDSVWNMNGFRLRLNEPASLQIKKWDDKTITLKKLPTSAP